MATFFGRLKNEIFYGFENEYTSFESFSRAIDDYIDYYNNRRIQAKTKWMPLSKFREASMVIVNYSVQMTVSRKLGTYQEPCGIFLFCIRKEIDEKLNKSFRLTII